MGMLQGTQGQERKACLHPPGKGRAGPASLWERLGQGLHPPWERLGQGLKSPGKGRRACTPLGKAGQAWWRWFCLSRAEVRLD